MLDLYVVDPRCDPRDGEAYKLACNSALMASLRVVSTLPEALADTGASIAFTRRPGALRTLQPSLSALLRQFPACLLLPAAAAPVGQDSMSSAAAPARDNVTGALEQDSSFDKHLQTALVFGREESGLSDDELVLCSHACAIPSGRIHGSLNLSQAVCVVLAQLFEMTSLGNSWSPSPAATLQQAEQESVALAQTGPNAPARWGEVDALVARFAQLAAAVGLEGAEMISTTRNHGRKRRVAGHMRAILGRARATQQEVRALHGFVKAALQRLGQQPAAVQGANSRADDEKRQG